MRRPAFFAAKVLDLSASYMALRDRPESSTAFGIGTAIGDCILCSFAFDRVSADKLEHANGALRLNRGYPYFATRSGSRARFAAHFNASS